MRVQSQCPSCKRIVIFDRGPRGEPVVLHAIPVCEAFPEILTKLDALFEGGGFERMADRELTLAEEAPEPSDIN